MIYDNRNIVNVYANRFRTEWTSADLRIRFGEIMYTSNVVSNAADSDPARSHRKLFVEERVGLTMTWLMAKELRDALDELVTKYEKANGTIVDGTVITTTPEEKVTEEPTEEPS